MICYTFLQEPKIVDFVMTFDHLNVNYRNVTPLPPSTPPNSVASDSDDEGFLERRSVRLLRNGDKLFVGPLGYYFRKSPVTVPKSITVLDSSTDTEEGEPSS